MSRRYPGDVMDLFAEFWDRVEVTVLPPTAGDLGPDSFEMTPEADMGCGYVDRDTGLLDELDEETALMVSVYPSSR